MSAQLAPRVMHLISARGGGMERFARDLLAHGKGHCLLHVAQQSVVVEVPGAPAAFYPYASDAPLEQGLLAALLAHYDCQVLHVHYLHRDSLELLQQWVSLGRPWLLSVHDVGFLNPNSFDAEQVLPQADPLWLARWQDLLASASVITVPSAFLAEQFLAAFPQCQVRIVAPGVRHADRVSSRRGLRTVAMVGALGPHKGTQRLLRWLAHGDAARYRWVLIGYTDEQLYPGLLRDQLQVHGPFNAADTAHWLQHYEVDLVLFPNRLAESFSYALSDVWAAGVPVLVPNAGALAQRVAALGGGAVLADADDAPALMRELQRLANDATLGYWRRRLRRQRREFAPSISAMVIAMQSCYAELPLVESALATDAQLQNYLRQQLDGEVFRHENIRLARDYAQVREWAQKLSADLTLVGQDLAAVGQARAQLEQQLAQRECDILGLRHRNLQIEQDAAELKLRNRQVEQASSELAALLGKNSADFAELQRHQQHLSLQLHQAREHAALLAAVCGTQAAEITVMHQRINALTEELAPLRRKGARYDRVRSWVPNWVLRVLRHRRTRALAATLKGAWA